MSAERSRCLCCLNSVVEPSSSRVFCSAVCNVECNTRNNSQKTTTRRKAITWQSVTHSDVISVFRRGAHNQKRYTKHTVTKSKFVLHPSTSRDLVASVIVGITSSTFRRPTLRIPFALVEIPLVRQAEFLNNLCVTASLPPRASRFESSYVGRTETCSTVGITLLVREQL